VYDCTTVNVSYYCDTNVLNKRTGVIATENTYEIRRKGQAGNTRKLNQHESDYLEDTIQTIRVGTYNDSVLRLYAYLKFHKNYKKVSSNETAKQYRGRLESQMNDLKNIMGDTLPMYRKSSHSHRLYYSHNYGFSPYGDHFESRVIRLKDTYITTEEDIKILKWLVYSELNGKSTIHNAVRYYNHSRAMLRRSVNVSKLKVEYKAMIKEPTLTAVERRGIKVTMTPNDLGDIMYFNEMVHIINEGVGYETDFKAEADHTNSGLQQLALATGDTKLMRIANFTDGRKIYDSHQELANSLKTVFNKDFSRNEAKAIGVSVYHGGGIPSMLRAIDIPNTTENQELMRSTLIDMFGEACTLPNDIALRGRDKFMGSDSSIISWTMDDGFVCEAVSYIPSCKVDLGGITVTCDMPSLSVGKMLIEGTKAMSLLAGITHSLDARCMRNTYRECVRQGIGLVDILDKVKCRPSDIIKIFDIQLEYYNNPSTMTMVDITNQIFNENQIKPKVVVNPTYTWLSA